MYRVDAVPGDSYLTDRGGMPGGARQENAEAKLEAVLPVLNRLSDYAFVLALAAEPDPGARSTETA